MNLKINDQMFVTDIRSSDKNSFVEHLKEKQIYDQTLAIPFPYRQSDADWWINHVAEETKSQGRSVNWAIRKGHDLIGGIGFHDFKIGKSHKAEIGYWLAKPFWNQGIMTDVVRKVCDFAFTELSLIRVTATVFYFNTGSSRVLEKAGFSLEGHLRSYYKKDGKIFDGKLYSKIN